MGVTAQVARPDTPLRYQIEILTAQATGTVNVGDWLMYSGQHVLAASASDNARKSSGAGVALQSNPIYDSFGNAMQATALQYVTQGILRVSAYSGAFALGTPVYPSSVGVGVAGPTGLTGAGAVWAPATKTACGSAFSLAIASVVGRGPLTNGSAEIDILLQPPRPDYY